MKSSSGIPIAKFYGPKKDAECVDKEMTQFEVPGKFPFTRGNTTEMYRSEPWLMGSYSGFGSAEEANSRFKELLASGTTSLNITLDLPTQQGLDSDHPLASGEVGRVGVAIDTLDDLERLLDDIDLSQVRNLSCIANAVSPILLGMFVVLAEKRGINAEDLRLYLQNDSLKEITARGNYIFPALASVKLSVDVMEYCRKHLTKSSTISFCGYHFRESGCTAIQEIAFTLANARAYMAEAIRRGLTADDLGPTLNMFLAAGMDLFEEISKFRATRRLWAHMMRDEFGAHDPKAQAITIRCYTSGSQLTAQRPLNNIVRTTIEALAGVLGGVQAMVVSSMDEALCIPSRETQQVALDTQYILYNETGIPHTADPLGGSYYVEQLTDILENAILKELSKIEEQGGAIAAIKKGYIQTILSESSYSLQREIEEGKRIIIGVNKLQRQAYDEHLPDLFRPDSEGESRQICRLLKLKDSRDANAVLKALTRIKEATMTGENVVPAVTEAVRLYATIGEITDVLKNAYGEAHDLGIF